jgi:hypothetical protein
VYLLTQVFTERDLSQVQSRRTTVINPTKKIKDLEQKVAFADTFQNRLSAADAYFAINDLENALEKYQRALSESSHKNDFYGNSQLLKVYFKIEN